jgi:hypothetical protein
MSRPYQRRVRCFFAVKQQPRRINTGRKNPDRVYRTRSDLQKLLGVRLAYVDIDSREVYIQPGIAS